MVCKKENIKKKVNFRKLVDASNETFISELEMFKFFTPWELPSFKVQHVR